VDYGRVFVHEAAHLEDNRANGMDSALSPARNETRGREAFADWRGGLNVAFSVGAVAIKWHAHPCRRPTRRSRWATAGFAARSSRDDGFDADLRPFDFGAWVPRPVSTGLCRSGWPSFIIPIAGISDAGERAPGGACR